MPNLTPYQEQRKREREEQEMQDRCADARGEERRLEQRLRAWTKRELGQIHLGLTDEVFPLLAHNWYLTRPHYGKGDPAFLGTARRVKQVMDHYGNLQHLSGAGRSGGSAWPCAKWAAAMEQRGSAQNCPRGGLK